MSSLVTPRRRAGPEILDDPAVDSRTRERSLRDVAISNTLFGGTGAVLRELDRTLARESTPTLTILDVGTGIGDIPERIRARAARARIRVITIGVDASPALLEAARRRGELVACADALALPFPDRSVDVAMCSQLLHHFDRERGIAVLREMDRVARRRVIVSDLRRSWLAAAGIWLASFPLRFHPVSRHDGVLSVLRGFTVDELREMTRAAVRREPEARRHRGFRLTAAWTPAGHAA